MAANIAVAKTVTATAVTFFSWGPQRALFQPSVSSSLNTSLFLCHERPTVTDGMCMPVICRLLSAVGKADGVGSIRIVSERQ